ncbi:hypothetical protein TNCV_3662441 [Trichonephila clavipes]|nr:hypothetical protein TNCV_3662441 [Trichonephila clavipes]
MPMKICRVEGLMHLKSVVAPVIVGVKIRRVGSPGRFRRLTMVLNYEVCPNSSRLALKCGINKHSHTR